MSRPTRVSKSAALAKMQEEMAKESKNSTGSSDGCAGARASGVSSSASAKLTKSDRDASPDRGRKGLVKVKPSFYHLELSVEPGGMRFENYFVLRTAQEIKEALQLFFGKNFNFALDFLRNGLNASLTLYSEGQAISEINLVPNLRLYAFGNQTPLWFSLESTMGTDSTDTLFCEGKLGCFAIRCETAWKCLCLAQREQAQHADKANDKEKGPWLQAQDKHKDKEERPNRRLQCPCLGLDWSSRDIFPDDYPDWARETSQPLNVRSHNEKRWLVSYFAVSLGCETPILEALWVVAFGFGLYIPELTGRPIEVDEVYQLPTGERFSYGHDGEVDQFGYIWREFFEFK